MTKILVVDDEVSFNNQLKSAAEKKDREIISAWSGKEAIELIEKNYFDVVVTDLLMETKHAGLDVLKAAKTKDIYTQVILVTRYGNPEINIEAMRLGAFDYQERTSPDHSSKLRNQIDKAIEFREAKLKEKNPS